MDYEFLIMRLIYVSLSYATYGLVERNGVIVDAPPIAKWMIGKDINFILNWIKRKRGL